MATDISPITDIITQMRDIKTHIASLNERYDALKEIVIEQLRGETIGLVDGQEVVKYTTQTRNIVDTKWLAQAAPEIYVNSLKQSVSTRFELVQETRNGQ